MLNQIIYILGVIHIDPEVEKNANAIALPFIILFVILVAGAGAWFLYKYLREKSVHKQEFDNHIWFDEEESELHRGKFKLKVPENSLEFYTCKLIFTKRNKYYLDLDILRKAKKADDNQRAVYFAVDRLNTKSKESLKLKEDLLKRGRERTSLNDMYR